MASANIWITRMCVCHPKYLCLRIVVCVYMCAHTCLLLLNVPRCRAVLLATSNNKYSYSLSAVCFCIYHFTLCLLLPLLDSINRSCRLPKEFCTPALPVLVAAFFLALSVCCCFSCCSCRHQLWRAHVAYAYCANVWFSAGACRLWQSGF